MNHILIPAANAEDWKRLLADPEKQWRKGYSAKALAYCWQEANGFPLEIEHLFKDSKFSVFEGIEFLFAIPEHKVPLPGGGRPSQNDLFVLAKAQGELISITIEGKVSEPFGPSLEEWLTGASPGKERRLSFLKELLGLPAAISPKIRYQLLHRSASALLEAIRFNAHIAVMIIHSFSQENQWLDDYQEFLDIFGVHAVKDQLFFVGDNRGVSLYCGWAKGNAKYLEL